eukprot:gene14486-20510_t
MSVHQHGDAADRMLSKDAMGLIGGRGKDTFRGKDLLMYLIRRVLYTGVIPFGRDADKSWFEQSYQPVIE